MTDTYTDEAIRAWWIGASFAWAAEDKLWFEASMDDWSLYFWHEPEDMKWSIHTS